MIFDCKWKVLPLCLPFLCMYITHFYIYANAYLLTMSLLIQESRSFGLVFSPNKIVSKSSWPTDELSRVKSSRKYICVYIGLLSIFSCPCLVDSSQADSQFKQPNKNLSMHVERIMNIITVED